MIILAETLLSLRKQCIVLIIIISIDWTYILCSKQQSRLQVWPYLWAKRHYKVYFTPEGAGAQGTCDFLKVTQLCKVQFWGRRALRWLSQLCKEQASSLLRPTLCPHQALQGGLKGHLARLRKGWWLSADSKHSVILTPTSLLFTGAKC